MKYRNGLPFFIAFALFTGCGTQNQESSSQAHSYNSATGLYRSNAEEPLSRQRKITNEPLPGHRSFTWTTPAPDHKEFGDFGVYGEHEGVDYAHRDKNVLDVRVVAAADGVVVYARTGCPESDFIGRNNARRNCGAGWGNHIVIQHTSGTTTVYTRYAHLRDETFTVRVGSRVSRGQRIAWMGNSGLSNMRHLHFEMGTRSARFDPAKGSQNFDAVYDPVLALPPRR